MQGIGANTGPFRVRSVQNRGMTIKSGGAFSLSSAEREGYGVMVTRGGKRRGRREVEMGGAESRWDKRNGALGELCCHLEKSVRVRGRGM